MRLWYVAATRARDLLVLPRHSAKLSDNSWARLVDFGLEHLEALDTGIWEGRRAAAEVQQNSQTREVFATEAVAIYKLRRTLVWQRPSRDEADWVPPPSPREFFESPEDAEECADVPVPAVAGSTARGLILHKLIEEFLTAELRGGAPEIEQRTLELLRQLGIKPVDDPKAGIAPAEIAGTVVRTLSLPEIARLGRELIKLAATVLLTRAG